MSSALKQWQVAGWTRTVAHRQRGSRAAFTLIEVLVVITIITILAAILLPVLARAKAVARRTQCLNQMRQWGWAFVQYADENEGWMPREGFHATGDVFWNNWAQVSDPRSRDVWYNVLPPYLSHPPASAYWRPQDRLRFYEPGSFFHCPSARFP